MQNKIQIKRSEVTSTPPNLSGGELAYSEVSQTLFIGLGDGTVVSIGGVAFTSKLNGIESNANNYIHPTTTGNRHIPTGGEIGQILKWSADGTGIWGNETGAVTSVAGKIGVVTLTKNDVGLENVDNTADSAKNVLSATKLINARTIAGISFDGTANIAIPLASLVKDANNRTITDTQLTQLSTLYNWYNSMTASDADSLVDTIAEVLNAFSGASEGLNVASQLTTPTSMTLDGGTF